MQARALGNALAIAFISVLLMFGALSISLVEFTPAATATAIEYAPPATLPMPTASPEPTMTSAVVVIVEAPTETASAIPTIAATMFINCPIPAGWIQVTVLQNDTLNSVAARYNTSATQLRDGNCLLTDKLIAGTNIRVPPLAQPPVSCTKGMTGWVNSYIVRAGDNIYSIALRYGTTSATLKSANCLTSDLIHIGEVLWVPNIPATFTPQPTVKPVDTVVYPTDPYTSTPLPFTSTPVPTPIPNTPTPQPTTTPSVTAFPN